MIVLRPQGDSKGRARFAHLLPVVFSAFLNVIFMSTDF